MGRGDTEGHQALVSGGEFMKKHPRLLEMWGEGTAVGVSPASAPGSAPQASTSRRRWD